MTTTSFRSNQGRKEHRELWRRLSSCLAPGHVRFSMWARSPPGKFSNAFNAHTESSGSRRRAMKRVRSKAPILTMRHRVAQVTKHKPAIPLSNLGRPFGWPQRPLGPVKAPSHLHLRRPLALATPEDGFRNHRDPTTDNRSLMSARHGCYLVHAILRIRHPTEKDIPDRDSQMRLDQRNSALLPDRVEEKCRLMKDGCGGQNYSVRSVEVFQCGSPPVGTSRTSLATPSFIRPAPVRTLPDHAQDALANCWGS